MTVMGLKMLPVGSGSTAETRSCSGTTARSRSAARATTRPRSSPRSRSASASHDVGAPSRMI
uniref:Uncharacterized protein n=1 Tax=Arundo donax TaxID=35708 RepID=A0A0A9AEK7_ARUDO